MIKNKLSDLIDIEKLQRLLDAFTKSAKGLATAILDLEGNVLVATGWHDICVKFHRVCPGTSQRCTESDTILAGQLQAGSPYNVYKCLNGLVDVAVPIVIQGVHLGNLFIGQFFFEPPDIEFFLNQATQYGFNEDEYLQALSQVPIFTEQQVKDYMDFLSGIVVFIGEIGQVNEQLVNEIDERRRLEEKIKSEKEFSESILEASPDSIYVFDPNTGKALRWNDAQSEISGYSHAEIATMKPVEDWYSEEEIEGIKDDLARLNQGEKITVYLNQICKDGKTIPFEYHARLVKDDEGNPKYVVSIGRNIQERKELERQLFQSQKMESLGTLAGGVAHDFNNLLAPILGYSQLVKMSLDPVTKEFKYLVNIEDSANRATDLVKKILIISRSSLADTESVQLKNLVEEVLTVLQASSSKNIDIRQEIDFDLPNISADPSQIYQVILNLCTNAVQSMSEDGELWIRLNRLKNFQFPHKQEQTRRDEFLCLSVQDNGSGMDEATLERIYEPFFTTKEKGEQRGTGLGLSIVSSVVKQHKGYIEVESHVGVGTIFRVYFPVLAMEETLSSSELVSFVVPGNEHILLVDDEKMVNEMGASILQDLGYRVSSFTESQEALHAFEANPQDFQLLVTDYSMPDLTGPQLMKKMKAIRSDIPMLLITGYSNLATPENLQEWGCDRIISKPYDIKKLSQTVSQVLAKAKSLALERK